MSTFNERYVELLKYLNLNSTSLSKILGYTSSTKLNRLEPQHGNKKPGLDILSDIFKNYPEINERWLILGEEKMLKKNIPTRDDKGIRGIKKISKYQTRIIELLEKEMIRHLLYSTIIQVLEEEIELNKEDG